MCFALVNWSGGLMLVIAAVYVGARERFVSQNMGLSEVCVPYMLVLVQRAMVSLKYAMLTRCEYAAYVAAPQEVASRWNKGLQLLSGWLPLCDELMAAEIDRATKLVNGSFRDCEFTHEMRTEEDARSRLLWQLITTKRSRRSCMFFDTDAYYFFDDGELAVPIRDMMHEMGPTSASSEPHTVQVSARAALEAFLRIAADMAMFGGYRVLKMDALVLPPMFMFHLARFTMELQLSGSVTSGLRAAFCVDSPLVAVCGFLCLCVNAVFYKSTFMFMRMVVVHYQRLDILLNALSNLARPVAATHPNLPHLRLDGACGERNVKAILLTFEVALHFGERYKKRLDSYAATIFGSSMLGLFFVLIQVAIQGTAHGAEKAEEKAEEEELQEELGYRTTWYIGPFVCIVLYVIVFNTVCVCSLCFHAANANRSFGRLANNIMDARWRCLLADSEGNHPRDEVLACAVERVARIEETEPIEFAGMVATRDLGMSVISLVTTAVAYILSRKLGLSLPL